MSGPSFGWVDMLHSLSLGMRLCRQADRVVFEKSNFDVDCSIVSDLVDKGLVVETTQGTFEITRDGKRALSDELEAISRRTSEWLKTLNRDGEN
jgi:predicted transcriptional regulator